MYELIVYTSSVPLKSLGFFYTKESAEEYYEEVSYNENSWWGYKIVYREDLL